MKKKLKISTLSIVLTSVVACSDDPILDNDINEVVDSKIEQLVEINSSSQLEKDLALDLKNRISNLTNKSIKSNLENINFDSATITDYEDSAVSGLTVPITEIRSYVTYALDGILTNQEMLIDISNIDNSSVVTYYNLNEELLGSITVTDGIITDSYGFDDVNINLRNDGQKGWFDDWGECVGVNLNTMTDGSVGGSIYGLACIAFGPECAAGIAIGCAIGASL